MPLSKGRVASNKTGSQMNRSGHPELKHFRLKIEQFSIFKRKFLKTLLRRVWGTFSAKPAFFGCPFKPPSYNG